MRGEVSLKFGTGNGYVAEVDSLAPETPTSSSHNLQPAAPRPIRRFLMAGSWGLLGAILGFGLMSRIAPLIWHHRPGPDFPDLSTLFKITGSTWLVGIMGLISGAIFGAWRCYAPKVSKRMLLVSGGLPVAFLLAAVASERWGWRELVNVASAGFCLTAIGFGILVLFLIAERLSSEA